MSDDRGKMHRYINSAGVVLTTLAICIGIYQDNANWNDQTARWEERDMEDEETAVMQAVANLADDPENPSFVNRIHELRKKYPENIKLKIAEATVRIEDREYNQADKLLVDVLNEDPDNVEAHLYKGQLHSKQWLGGPGQLDRAIDAYREAIDCFETRGVLISRLVKEYAFHSLAVALHRNGQVDESVAVLKKAQALPIKDDSKRRPGVPKLLGKIHRSRGEYSKAVEQFEIALELAPGNREIAGLLEATTQEMQANSGSQ